MDNIKIEPIIDIPNEVIGIKLPMAGPSPDWALAEDTLEAQVDFKKDEIYLRKNNIYLYRESIETSCWTCFIGYLNCLRFWKYGNKS